MIPGCGVGGFAGAVYTHDARIVLPSFEEDQKRCHKSVPSGLPELRDLGRPVGRSSGFLRCKQPPNSG